MTSRIPLCNIVAGIPFQSIRKNEGIGPCHFIPGTRA